MRELKETVNLMNSDNYKERFIAEYWQLKIRYEKLKDFCNKIKAAELVDNVRSPKHDVPLHILLEQQCLMGDLLSLLEVRAIIEDIDLRMYIKSNDEEE